MENPQEAYNETGTNDLPPPYSSVAGNPYNGFISASGVPLLPPKGATQPKSYTAPGVCLHLPPNIAAVQMQNGEMTSASAPVMPAGIAVRPVSGCGLATVTCTNCGKNVTTRNTQNSDLYKYLVAGCMCVATMMCSLFCFGAGPY